MLESNVGCELYRVVLGMTITSPDSPISTVTIRYMYASLLLAPLLETGREITQQGHACQSHNGATYSAKSAAILFI